MIDWPLVGTILGIVYLVVFIGLFIGIRIEAARQDIEFTPLQPITAFLWGVWVPFLLVERIINGRRQTAG